MNVKEFISGGIIESYVLGLCTDADRREVESACEHFPEIASAVAQAEEKVETLLVKEQRTVPPALKEKIFARISSDASTAEDQTEINEESPSRYVSMWKWVAAASMILLAGSLFWIYQLKKENKELARNATVVSTDDSTRHALTETKAELEEMRSAMKAVQSPALKMASLKATPVMPGAKASVFWDTTTKEVYLVLNNLPQPATEQQYQLWALINKKPVDLGVLDHQVFLEKRLLIKMKNVQNAEAFAITLEPQGGSTQPTMNKMYVYGKL